MSESEEVFEKVNIEDEMQRSYIDYSMSVIVGRALPDARDGLKPCNRRILFAMQQGGWTHTRSFIKCARVVGEVMGKYHPHGDGAVYDTLVRMAQDFSMRSPLINSQGNFGSIDGDPPAAYRYTECRLNKLAEELLSDIDKNTVDMRLNFDEKLQEPTVLPARFPNLLANGSTGIAVGMATNIPPHNLGELVDGICHLIDNPEATVADLMVFVKGPDFPTGGQVCGLGQIRQMYETGRGHIKCRGKAHIEENEKSKDRILITEVPFNVNKANMISRMAELVNEKKLEGISDIRDESNKDGIRVVIELKRGAIPKVVLNNIFKQTQMQTTFGAIMLALDNNRPEVMTLKKLMTCFIQHRFEVITRRAEYDLAKAKDRAHILEGYLIALDNLDDVVKIIRASANREEARTGLISKFGFSERQANAILDMRLYQLTGMERGKIEAEYAAVMALIAELEDLLAHPEKIYALIKEDLHDIKGNYANERRTELTIDENEINIEDLIEDRPIVLTISHEGYIKRVPLDTYREQRRGGKGVIGMDTKDEDFVEQVFTATTHDRLLFFTEKGRMYVKKVYEVPEGGRTSRGKAIVNLLELSEGEKIASMVRIREFNEDQFLVFATQQGVVKKTCLSRFKNIRTNGIIAIAIDEEDLLIGVLTSEKTEEVMLITREGMSIRFNEEQLRDQGRATRGVRGIRLGKENDAVVSICKVIDGCTLLVAAEKGYGKRTDFSEYRQQSRGGKGLITLKTSDKTGLLVGALTVNPDDALMMITAQGQMVRTGLQEMRIIGRSTQGVRLINLKDEDRLISLAPIASDESEDSETNAKEETPSTNKAETTTEETQSEE